MILTFVCLLQTEGTKSTQRISSSEVRWNIYFDIFTCLVYCLNWWFRLLLSHLWPTYPTSQHVGPAFLHKHFVRCISPILFQTARARHITCLSCIHIYHSPSAFPLGNTSNYLETLYACISQCTLWPSLLIIHILQLTNTFNIVTCLTNCFKQFYPCTSEPLTVRYHYM
jgi:hypothetical protein